MRGARPPCLTGAVIAVVVTMALAAGCGGSDDAVGDDRAVDDAKQAAWQASSDALEEEKKTARLEQRVKNLEQEGRDQAAEIERQRVAAARARAKAAKRARAVAAPAPAPGTAAPSRPATTRPRGLVSGQFGIAYGPPGRQPTVVGDLVSGPGWSTMKVPVAVAVSRRTGGSSSTMAAVITRSDNASAVAMWGFLGSPSQAGAAVQQVLAEGGDTATSVQTRVVRSGFTSFGQTDWSIVAQQTFAKNLSCVTGAAPVVRLMSQIDPSQRWGLGSAGSDQQFKGGWGPDPDGRYLVRQFGTIRVSSGVVAVAIAVRPADGQFGTGTAELSRLAQWVAKNAKGGEPLCG